METQITFICLFLVILGFSAAQEMEDNLTAIIGGNITLPAAVIKTGFLLYNRENIASVFNGELIDVNIYKNKVQWNRSSGLFMITNLQKNDSGIYIVQKGKFYSSYNLRVYDPDEYIKLDFLVGTNATLRSKLQKLEEDHVISWLFGKLFPEREIASSEESYRHLEDPFDKVFLNLMNGDLIIPQITKNFSGKYYFKIKKGEHSYFLEIYDVRVFDQVSVPNITKSTAPPTNGVCSVTCSVENGPEVNLTWFRGNISISSSSSNQNVSTLTLLQHIRAEDSSTYSCWAQNPVSVQRKTLDSQWLTCHNAGTAKLWVILIIVTIVVMVVVGAGLFIHRKKWKRGCVRDPQGSQSNRETSPQNCRSSLTSEEFLLQRCQGPSYETVK